jgi:hypothetical protein
MRITMSESWGQYRSVADLRLSVTLPQFLFRFGAGDAAAYLLNFAPCHFSALNLRKGGRFVVPKMNAFSARSVEPGSGSSPNELAQKALQANIAHQHALTKYAGQLEAELQELDNLIVSMIFLYAHPLCSQRYESDCRRHV